MLTWFSLLLPLSVCGVPLVEPEYRGASEVGTPDTVVRLRANAEAHRLNHDLDCAHAIDRCVVPRYWVAENGSILVQIQNSELVLLRLVFDAGGTLRAYETPSGCVSPPPARASSP